MDLNLKKIFDKHILIIGSISLLVGLGSVITVSILDIKWVIITLLGFLVVTVLFFVKRINYFLFGLLIFSIPLGIDFSIGAQKTIGLRTALFISLTDLILGILLIIWFINKTFYGENSARIYLPFTNLPIFLFISTGVLSLLWSVDQTVSFYGAIQLAKGYLLYLLVSNSIKNETELKRVLWVMFLTVPFQGIIVLWQLLNQSGMNIPFLNIGSPEVLLSSQADKFLRPTGTLGHSGPLAAYMNLVIIFGFVLLLNPKWRKNNKDFLLVLIARVASFIGLIIVIFSLMRGAWVSCLVGLFSLFSLMIWKKLWSLRKFLVILLLSLLILSTGFSIFRDIILPKIQQTRTIKWRIEGMKLTFKIIKDHPILGVGLNGFTSIINEFEGSHIFQLEDEDMAYFIPVHNLYLFITVNTGIISLVFFIWIFYRLFKSSFKLLRSRNMLFSFLSIAIISAFTGFFIHGLVSIMIIHPTVMNMFWFLLGMAGSIERLSTQQYLNEISTGM